MRLPWERLGLCIFKVKNVQLNQWIGEVLR